MPLRFLVKYSVFRRITWLYRNLNLKVLCNHNCISIVLIEMHYKTIFLVIEMHGVDNAVGMTNLCASVIHNGSQCCRFAYRTLTKCPVFSIISWHESNFDITRSKFITRYCTELDCGTRLLYSPSLEAVWLSRGMRQGLQLSLCNCLVQILIERHLTCTEFC